MGDPIGLLRSENFLFCGVLFGGLYLTLEAPLG